MTIAESYPTPSAAHALAPPAFLRQNWDAIVVGSGMGGATLGHHLARNGKSVLFCELGGGETPALRGAYPELAGGRRGGVLDAGDSRVLLRAGRYPDTLCDASGARERTFVPFIGAGPGGSSALYGMALERFMPSDFQPGEFHRGAPGAAIVASWPITYEELAPHYAAAEAQYRVRGEIDPLAAAQAACIVPPALLLPPPLSSAGAELASFLAGRGLHPYRLPTACEFLADCHACQGVLCPQPCKIDANSACLQPALHEHGAQLLSDARVLAVHVDGRRATGIRCAWAGRELDLRARVVVLAAGALQSPLILLRSHDRHGHTGLGNSSGAVGRHLMRHLIDLYLVRPRGDAGEPFDNRRKEIACNDFYTAGGDKLGTLQSFGRLPPADMLFGALRDDLHASRMPWLASALRPLRPLLRPILQDLSDNWLTLATIAEDLPYADNAVTPHPAGPSQAMLRYTLRPEALQRNAGFRQRMEQVLRGRSWRRLAQASNNQRIAHVCGTCRFGDDPGSSVLDRDNRVHDVDNLFVVDSSFFPSSGGTNPSLTIAANALRVGAKIVQHMP
jgi:choline dehydrogenase-like flavoprotein